MACLDLLKIVLDDQSLDHNEFRNILLVGDVDEKRFSALSRRYKDGKVTVVAAGELQSVGDIAKVVTLQEDPENLLVIQGVENLNDDLVQAFVQVMRDRILDIDISIGDVGDVKTVRVDLSNFNLFCTAGPDSQINDDLINSFHLKVLVGEAVALRSKQTDFGANNLTAESRSGGVGCVPVDEDGETGNRSGSLEFNQASQVDEVIEALQAIEDKLYEKGMLTSATGDPEAEATVRYKEWEDAENERGPYLCIEILSPKAQFIDEEKFEEISDYVNEKINDAQEEWPLDVCEALSVAWGQVVILNGRKVY